MVNDSYEFTEGWCSVDVCGGSREFCCHIRLRCGFVQWCRGGFYLVSLEVPAWLLSLARGKKWLSCSASLVTFPGSGENGWIFLDRAKNGSLKVPVWSLFLAWAKIWLGCPRSANYLAWAKLAVVYLKIRKLYWDSLDLADKVLINCELTNLMSILFYCCNVFNVLWISSVELYSLGLSE